MCAELNPDRVELLTAVVFTCAVVRYSHQVEVECKETVMNQKRIAEAVLWLSKTKFLIFVLLTYFFGDFLKSLQKRLRKETFPQNKPLKLLKALYMLRSANILGSFMV